MQIHLELISKSNISDSILLFFYFRYELMKECWSEEPMSRPSFTECADRLGNVLEDTVKQVRKLFGFP